MAEDGTNKGWSNSHSTHSSEPTFRFSFRLLFLLKTSFLLVSNTCEKVTVTRTPSKSVLSTTFSYQWSRSLLLNSRCKIRDQRTFEADSENIPLKSDWLVNKNEHSELTQKLAFRFLVLARRIAASGDENAVLLALREQVD